MRTVTILVISALLSAPAFAHKSGTPGERMMHHMTKSLDLTDTQQEQVKAIFESKKPEMEALHEQMKALRESTNTEIKAILNDEQKAKFEEQLERREEKRQKHRDRYSKHHD